MTTEVEKQETREYGFTVMVKQDGKIEINPHNLGNDFEFVGLVEYVNQKKSDILHVIGQSVEARTLHSVGVLAKGLLASVAQSSDQPAG